VKYSVGVSNGAVLFGLKRKAVTEVWTDLHKEKHHGLYCSPNFIREDGMGGTCGMYGVKEKCMHRFGGEPAGKSPLGRPTRRW